MITVLFLLFAAYIFLFLSGALGWMNTPIIAKNAVTKIRKISIIIPARNEAENIGLLIEDILKNEYPQEKYEIIIIDDHSEDDTASIVLSYSYKHAHVQLLKLSEFIDNKQSINSFKKMALSYAIAHASGEIILQTDADCRVNSRWLSSINACFENEQINTVAAPVDLIPLEGNFFKKVLYWFQSLDFMTMQGITAATHYFHIGAMANGANIAYRKNIFIEVNSFEGIDLKATGDDMMLMQKILQKHPNSSMYLKDKNAIVRTLPPDSIQDFLKQRIRWSAKAANYEDKRLTIILTIVYLFNLSMLILLFMAIWNAENTIDLLLFFLVKTAIELLIVIPLSTFFGKIKQVFIFPFLQPLHILYIVVSGFFGANGKYEWKGRKVY